MTAITDLACIDVCCLELEIIDQWKSTCGSHHRQMWLVSYFCKTQQWFISIKNTTMKMYIYIL